MQHLYKLSYPTKVASKLLLLLVTSTSGGNVSNVVIISDVQENIAPILSMIERLDIPIANVNIAVKFIESGVDTAKGSGIDWS